MELTLEHHWLALIVIYFLYSALVSGMPKPETVPEWGAGYVWLYTSSQVLAGNVDKIFGKFLTRFIASESEK